MEEADKKLAAFFIISKGDENHTLTRVRKDKLKRCSGK